ncbi:phosphatidate phosphatase PPAPDC1B-like [Yasminevirus sp. GU-2018]|uniref:Phosphatidate phosphatase PPAPDC1B-like n=1 Tax=Yasminevirus sp. GU-2018 TaxID=2420051 RepID=A0A5K0UA52_9VIRU|nr:phosphatidate phosphatase PPAPDC1B-like [Yasminevirus sp. GU-2018]
MNSFRTNQNGETPQIKPLPLNATLEALVAVLVTFVPVTIYFSLMQAYDSTNHVFRQVFIEQDPRLSMPSVEKTHVPNMMLALLSCLVPCVGLLISSGFVLARTRSLRHVQVYTFIVWTCFAMCLLLNSAGTNSLKILYGAPRPSFFAICNYHGYRDALSSNNFTEYFELTHFGRFGDIANCRDKSDINDAFMSFPSGHSSLMFAGATYMSLVMFMFRQFHKLMYVLAIFVSGGVMVLSTWVTYTRVADYKHNTQDVLAGTILGFVLGFSVFQFARDLLIRCELSPDVFATPDTKTGQRAENDINSMDLNL